MGDQRTKGAAGDKIATAGLSVVLAGALAVGIGTLVLHNNRDPKTHNAADARRQPNTVVSSSGVPTVSPRLKRSGRASTVVPKPTRTSPKPHAAARPSGVESIVVNIESAKCIDVTKEGATGIPIQIWTCGPDTPWKDWTPYSDGTLRSMGQCMTAARTTVVLSPCNGGQAQRFRLNGSEDLVTGGLCVGVEGADNADQLRLAKCVGTSDQKRHFG